MIDWSTALLNSGYKLREMRRAGRESENEESAQQGGLHVSLTEVNPDN